jgi:hypothetical protein
MDDQINRMSEIEQLKKIIQDLIKSNDEKVFITSIFIPIHKKMILIFLLN